MDKEIKKFIEELISKFPEKVRNSKDIFNEFITYVYCTIEDKIVLQYFVANEKAITSEILKKKNIQ